MESMGDLKACHFQMFSLQCPDEVVRYLHNLIVKPLKEGIKIGFCDSLCSVKAPRKLSPFYIKTETACHD